MATHDKECRFCRISLEKSLVGGEAEAITMNPKEREQLYFQISHIILLEMSGFGQKNIYAKKQESIAYNKRKSSSWKLSPSKPRH